MKLSIALESSRGLRTAQGTVFVPVVFPGALDVRDCEVAMRKRSLKTIGLTKETLRSLEASAFRRAAGGISHAVYTCDASCVTDVTCMPAATCKASCISGCC
jgi:hypothetical protein